jgi:site-specific DNA recombinase
MTKRTSAGSGDQRVIRVAGYVRVSSQRQVSEGDSLLAQQHEIEQEVEFRKRREGWQVESLDFYVDAGKSAKDQNRPQLQRLTRDIAAGKIDLVICFKLDRITRSLKDFVDLWELFEQHGVDVISLREKFDTSTPTGKAMLRLIIVFAELEREMTAERTFSNMRDRVERGLWNGGHILGYRSDPQDKGKLILDEDGARIVRRIFDLFDELGSAGAVTRKLHELGIRYPTYETRSGKLRGGKPFVKQKVIGILRNPLYIGQIRWGEAFRDDCHEAIISREQFERARHRLAQTVRRRQNLKQVKSRRYLLTGLLRCQCGAHMVGAAAHGRNGVYRYYICTRQNHEGGKSSCQAPRLPADALEFALLERVRELGSVAEARDRIVRQALECIDGESQRLKDEEEIVRRQAAKVRADINRLLEVLKTLGTKGLPSVQDELGRLEQEETELRQRRQELSDRQVPLARVSDEARRFVETWKDVGELLDQATPDERHLILQHYIEVVELRAIDEKGKAGTYALRLFPEVRPHRDPDDPDGLSGSGVPRYPTPPETPNGAATLTGSDPALLTEDGLVRTAVQKAPRVGFEPTTNRLTAGCSTVELSGKLDEHMSREIPSARSSEEFLEQLLWISKSFFVK